MGPLATAEFQRQLVQNTSATRDQDHLHVIVDSDPTIPDRTAFLLDSGQDPRPALGRCAQRLVQAGAELLVMPCNTANVFADDVEQMGGAPLVPWFEPAVQAVVANAPAKVVRCGVLATTGTLIVGHYADLIRRAGGVAIEPVGSQQARVMEAIYGPAGVKATGGVDSTTRRGLLQTAQELVADGANVLLLACTELPLAIPVSDPAWPVPAVDPGIEVARLTIRMAGGEVRQAGLVS
jgi:aspartate racemase